MSEMETVCPSQGDVLAAISNSVGNCKNGNTCGLQCPWIKGILLPSEEHFSKATWLFCQALVVFAAKKLSSQGWKGPCVGQAELSGVLGG